MSGLKRAAVSCVLYHGNKFLLLQRNKAPHIGKYLPVGGKIDPFESLKSAVLREVFEETGLKIDMPTYCGSLVECSPLDHYNWVSFIFKAEIDFIKPPYCDEGQLVWIEDSQLELIDMPPTDLPIYKAIRANESFVFDAHFDAQMNMIQMHRIA